MTETGRFTMRIREGCFAVRSRYEQFLCPNSTVKPGENDFPRALFAWLEAIMHQSVPSRLHLADLRLLKMVGLNQASVR